MNLDEHPFILAARWVDEFSGRPYVVMDHIAPDAWGRVSLSDHLANPHGSLDMDRSMSWAIEFCHGMEYAIRRGMRSHRDIKPSNILLTQDETLKISDFGLAKGAEAAWGQGTGPFVTGAGRGAFGLSLLKSDGKGVCGTPGYIAPEVIRGDGADVRSDIYSFGIVLWQMATGSPVPPFPSPVQQDVNEYVREVYQQQMRGRVPAGGGQLREAIERCLSPEPLRSYKDFEQLRKDIENLFRKRTGRVIELPPAAENNDDFWNNKGASLYALGRHEDAINCFDKAIEINPHGAAAWNNRGNPLMSLGRHEEALACYSKALEINPQVPRSAMIWPPHCLANKGRALCALGRDEEALACYSKALTIDPRQAGVWNNKGVLLCALGRYQEALTCCGKATEIDPQSSFAWDNMGRALHGLGRSKEAIECFSKAFQIDPQSTGSCFQIGLILSELKPHSQVWSNRNLLRFVA